MATAPFGPVLETALKHDSQGGKLSAALGGMVTPAFYCCISGNTVGVAKDPVAHMKLDARRVCTMVPITVDYSGSWSPSCTINSWTVTWGDGNVTTGGWPGAGSTTHPGGGYALPGTYHIILTVTDLLGATGMAEATVEIIDCTAGPPVLLMGGCGASGPWFTANAGINWSDAGTGVLAGVEIYDIGVNTFTLGMDDGAGGIGGVELWACTELGLYKRSLGAWTRIDTFPPSITPYAVKYSNYMQGEVYVLGQSKTANIAYLCRTTTDGLAWDVIVIGAFTITLDFNTVGYCRVDSLAEYNGEMWFGYLASCGGGACDISGHATKANSLAAWSTFGGCGVGVVPTAHRFAAHTDGKMYGIWYDNCTSFPAPAEYGVAVYNGVSWAHIRWDTVGYAYPDETDSRSGCAIISTSAGVLVISDNTFHTYNGTSHTSQSAGLGWGTLTSIAELYGTVYCTVKNAGTYRIYSYDGGAWTQEYESTNVLCCVTAYAGSVWAIERGTTSALLRNSDGTWDYDSAYIHTPPGITLNSMCVDSSGNMYAIGAGGLGINYWIGKREIGMWVTLSYGGAVSPFTNVAIFDSGMYTGREGFVYLAGAGSSIIPTTGRTHLLDMSADGAFVYAGILSSTTGNPVVIRITYDLMYTFSIYNVAAGTWGGVACDPYFGNVVWLFGDFGAATKVLRSEDGGDTFTNVGNAGWGAAEVARPLLISYWDTNDVVVMLDSALQCWQSKDNGVTWGAVGNLAFAPQCGARDYWEPLNVWIGSAAAGGNHIQYSPNAGVDWAEHSGGFTAAAPVSALEVVG